MRHIALLRSDNSPPPFASLIARLLDETPCLRLLFLYPDSHSLSHSAHPRCHQDAACSSIVVKPHGAPSNLCRVQLSQVLQHKARYTHHPEEAHTTARLAAQTTGGALNSVQRMAARRQVAGIGAGGGELEAAILAGAPTITPVVVRNDPAATEQSPPNPSDAPPTNGAWLHVARQLLFTISPSGALEFVTLASKDFH